MSLLIFLLIAVEQVQRTWKPTLRIDSSVVVGKIGKIFFIYYGKVITEYVADDIDFNSVCQDE